MRVMLRFRTLPRVEADLAALHASADRAGVALACVFASSDEYEAHIIRERRASGAFRPRKPWRQRLRLIGLAQIEGDDEIFIERSGDDLRARVEAAIPRDDYR